MKEKRFIGLDPIYLGKEICKILGLNPNLTGRITITIDPGEVLTIIAQVFATEEIQSIDWQLALQDVKEVTETKT